MSLGRSLLAAALVGVIPAGVAMAQAVDVTAPSDPIELVNGTNDGDPDSGPPPMNEGVANAIDNTAGKYLNFLDLGSGFTVTPAFGSGSGGTIVTGIRVFTANDAEARDPASFLLEGSTTGSGGTFTTIASGPIALPAARNDDGTLTDFADANFANSTAYTTYRLTFPTLKDAAGTNSMQIGEADLLGTLVPEPTSLGLVALGGLGLLARRRRA